jgi:hypothetical protein
MKSFTFSNVAKLAKPLLLGGTAGLAGTIPMTVFMLLAHRLLPRSQQYALPPQRIVDRIASKLGFRRHLDKPQRQGLALGSHLGYGAATGAVFAETVGRLPLKKVGPRQISLGWPAGGVVFALVVWAASYLGWLPAAGLAASVTEEPKERTALMIGAHVIWGATTGLFMSLGDHAIRNGVEEK